MPVDRLRERIAEPIEPRSAMLVVELVAGAHLLDRRRRVERMSFQKDHFSDRAIAAPKVDFSLPLTPKTTIAPIIPLSCPLF